MKKYLRLYSLVYLIIIVIVSVFEIVTFRVELYNSLYCIILAHAINVGIDYLYFRFNYLIDIQSYRQLRKHSWDRYLLNLIYTQVFNSKIINISIVFLYMLIVGGSISCFLPILFMIKIIYGLYSSNLMILSTRIVDFMRVFVYLIFAILVSSFFYLSKIRHITDDIYLRVSFLHMFLIGFTIILVSLFINYFMFTKIIKRYPFQNQLAIEQFKAVKFL